MLFKTFRKNRPTVSVIVSVFNMVREAKRTLLSLSVPYQRDVHEDDYEVIVVDDGSAEPLSEEFVTSFGKNFRYFYFANTSKSPAGAINFGVGKAQGKFLGLMVDGARMATPGIIKYALAGMKLHPNPVVATLGWHLGPDAQYRSVSKGYNKETEDALLESIDWTKNGYKLFEISSFGGSSKDGYFLPIGESNCLFLMKETIEKLGGLDERFKVLGGGLVNLDIYRRACELPDSKLIVMLGEGTFHQLHGGVSTNMTEGKNLQHWNTSEAEYIELRKSRFSSPSKAPELIGHIPVESLKYMEISIQRAMARQEVAS